MDQLSPSSTQRQPATEIMVHFQFFARTISQNISIVF
jgi:hypothetical protein